MKARVAPTFLFLFVLFIGIGHIALLPPFEGHDEHGHYSSIRQVADTGTIPTVENGFFDQAVFDYKAKGPFAYAAPEPHEENGGLTYPTFFENEALVSGYAEMFRNPTAHKTFVPSDQDNWQVQHPPLYYLVMAPIARLSSGLSFTGQFFVLRLFSYLLALSGLLIGLAGTLRFVGVERRKGILYAFLSYPLILPQFFPEFARLGNDSLCLFLMGIAWPLMLRWSREETNFKLSFLLGVTLGAGLLTKAFFLPVVAGFGFFVLLRLWSARHEKARLLDILDSALMMAFPIILGSFWYFYKWKATGSFIGHPEYVLVAKQGGVWPLFWEKATFEKLFNGFLAIPATWSWAGTGSLSQPFFFLQLPVLVLPFWLMGRYVLWVRKQPLIEASWLPVWFFFPFLFGLSEHVFYLIALKGSGGTPGWYLHILLPVFACTFAWGFSGLAASVWRLRLLRGLLLYAVLFLLGVLWSQLPIFAGITKIGKYRVPDYSSFPLDLSRFAEVISRLEIIVWPWVGLACFGAAFVFLALGAFFGDFGRRNEAVFRKN